MTGFRFRRFIFTFLSVSAPSRLSSRSMYLFLKNFLEKKMTSTAGACIRDNSSGKIGVKQMFDDVSCTYTYLIWDTDKNVGVIVDPVDTQVDRDLKEVEKLGIKLSYGLNTHAHADHITGTGLLKEKVKGFKSVISTASGAKADVLINQGDQIIFGNRYLEARATPGHTVGCLSYVADDGSFVLTGDTLLIKGCGRTDFQGGSAKNLYESIHSQLFTLSNECIVYPAHDYKGRTHSTIGEEKADNPRMGGNKVGID